MLPRYDTSRSHLETNTDPIFMPVYEFDFNLSNLEHLNCEVFGYKLKGNKLKILINLQEDFNIKELVGSLNDLTKIDIKLHNKKGEIFKIIENRISFEGFDYEIKGGYDTPLHIEIEFKNINTTFIEI